MLNCNGIMKRAAFLCYLNRVCIKTVRTVFIFRIFIIRNFRLLAVPRISSTNTIT